MFYDYDIAINCPPYVFGDGQHETTRFLLYFLNRYARGKSVIDAGCGTGILALFASKCGATSVIAMDCDGNAVECTKANVEANKVNVSVIETDIENGGLPSADIVTANLARWDALHHLPHLKNLINKDGLLITTWYKELPKEALLKHCKVVDHIEGINYDCYVLKIIESDRERGSRE